jgi:hypothetical protein
MGTGYIGGKLGNSISQHYERKYGKAKTNIGVGIVSIIISLMGAIYYYQEQPAITDAYVAPYVIKMTRFVIGDGLTIWSNGLAYSARPRFWRPEITDATLRQALSSSNEVTLWLFPGETHIFGLKAGALTIPTKAGISEYMSNRFALLLIWVGFLTGGCISAGYGARLQYKNKKR